MKVKFFNHTSLFHLEDEVNNWLEVNDFRIKFFKRSDFTISDNNFYVGIWYEEEVNIDGHKINV